MNQQQTISQSGRIQRRMERLYLPKVYKALQSQVGAFTDDLKAFGMQPALSRLSTELLNDQIGPVIKSIYMDAALSNARYVYGNVRRYEKKLNERKAKALPEPGSRAVFAGGGQENQLVLKLAGFGFNDVWTKDVLRYFELYLLEKAVLPISATTKRIIQEAVEKATVEGWGIDQTVKYLQTLDITKSRARTIVRTETVRATNFGGMLGAWESKLVMEKGWISAHNKRTRGTRAKDEYSHLSLHGQQVGLLEPFKEQRKGENIQFPGDPEASAGNTINCRCTLGFVPKRDENGRLIRKPESMQTQQANGYRPSLVDFLTGLFAGLNIMEMINEN